jgi:hypothetical protein
VKQTPNEREWLEAEKSGPDPLAEMLFARLVAEMPPIEPRPDFVGLTVQAAWRARARHHLVRRLARIAAVLAVGIAGVGSIYELRGLAVVLIVRGAVVLSHGLVWLLTSASQGIRWWWIADRIGAAVGDTIAAPAAAAAFVAAEMIVLVAIFAFKRLIQEDRQTQDSRWAPIMTTRLKCLVVACAVLLTFSAAMFVLAQTSSNVTNLRDQLRQRYDVVALRDGVGLVPHQRNGDIRLIEIRNGGVAINGDALTAREARARLGQDAELILRITYLDAAAQRELARADAAATGSQAGTGGGPNEDANQPEPTQSGRTQTHRGDLVRIGGSVSVARDEVVDGDVVAIGGSADIDGEVVREVTVVGGSLNLGPDAIVRGDVTVVGGTLTRSPSARTYGKVDNVGFGAQFPFPLNLPANRRFARGFPFQRPFSQVGGLLGTALRMTLLILAALVVVALGGRLVESIANRAATEPLRSGLVGLLAEVLFLPLLIITIVVLAVSIVGIPLLLLVPFGMVLVVVLMLVGFAGIACQVGRLVSDRFGIRRGPYASVALGIVVVIGITLVARIISLAGGLVFGLVVAGSLAAVGYLVEYLAWTIGLGAVILTWLDGRRRAAPPIAGSAPTSTEAPAQ